MKKHTISLVLFFMLCAICVVNAQELKQVVINLNTGYQVKGELLEQTSEGIKIKAPNGEVYEYKSEEIKGIEDTKQSSSNKSYNKPFSSAKKDARPSQEGNKPQVGQGTFSYHFGLAIPTGNFADDIGTRSGSAGLGLNLGIQYLYPLSENGLSLFAGLDLNYNGIKKSSRDDIEEEYDSDVDLTFSKYLNIPVSGGLHYTYVLNEKVSLYGKGGLAASFLKMTNMKVTYGNEEAISKFDMSTNLGLTLGGGLILSDKIDIAITYWGLGEHEIKGEVEYDGDTEKLDRYKLDDSLFTLTVGFKF
jgi:opacity protein-like surface antigen